MRARIIPIRIALLVCSAVLLGFGVFCPDPVAGQQCKSDGVNPGITDPIKPNAEFNQYAAIAVDATNPACKDTAKANLEAKLAGTLSHSTVNDIRIKDGTVPPFQTWLAGDMVTHIFHAALALEQWQLFVSPSRLQQVRDQYYGIRVPQERDQYGAVACGLASGKFVNSCMDDFALTAAGFAWIAAYENRKNAGSGNPQPYIDKAQAAIAGALSRMSDPGVGPDDGGGGPCFWLIGSFGDGLRCDADFAGSGGPVKIIGADHNEENPAYGFGLMTSVAAACAGLYIAGAPCSFTGDQTTVATELMRHAQEKSTSDGSAFLAGACIYFPTGESVDCNDPDGPGAPPNGRHYLPKDFALQRFYDKKGIPRPNSGYQFTEYSAQPPNSSDLLGEEFWSYNRQEVYGTLAYDIWGSDAIAPVVAWTSPADGSVVSGIVTLAVNATDNLKVSSVELYANGYRLTPTYNDCSQISGATAITAPPWRLCVDTSSGSVDGTYTLTAKAYDDAGNVGNSAPITITVSNPGCLRPPTGLRYEGFPSRNIVWNPPDNATAADQVHYDLWLFGPSCPNGCEIAPGAPSWYTIGPSIQGGTYTWRLQAISNSRCYSVPLDGPSFVLTQLDLYINRTTFHTTDADWTIQTNSTLVGYGVTLIEEFWNGSYWQEDWRGGVGQIPTSGVLTFVGGAPYFAGSFRSHVEAAGSSSGYVYYSVTP